MKETTLLHKRKTCRPTTWGAIVAAFLLLASCARMGSPDGGWFDDTPPYVVSSQPADQATGVRSQRVVINFSEYIKLEDAQSKVIVSPPQLEMPDIKTQGKRIVVDLKDSLKDNTTYTIDFSDAISDNTEGNPMGNYTYSFSTGNRIDTLEVAGYVLNAADLEPIKGVLVGLYEATDDSASLTTKPFLRVSRSDSRGRFVIKGVAPGTYTIAALQDADGDFLYSQKSEAVAFTHQTFEPSWKPDVRQDTIWRDSLHISTIKQVPYTHFLPDDITLLAFQAVQSDRYLLKTERSEPDRLTLFFTYGSDSLPTIRGLNFVADSAFVLEPSLHRDTLTYWLRDTLLVNQDTLAFALTYQATDTLGQLQWQTDTIEALAKVPYEKRMKEAAKDYEKWKKEQDRRKKREEPYDSIMPPKPMELKINAPQAMAPDENISIELPAPLLRCDTAAIHLYSMIDSVWYESPHSLQQTATRHFRLLGEWRPGVEYSLEMDSAAFVDIYGKASPPFKRGLKIKTLEEFSSLSVAISGMPTPPADTLSQTVIVELLDAQDKVVRRQTLADGTADFFYLKPGKYYLRAFQDWNDNQLWDTGDYYRQLQAEPVYYHNETVECKEKWDVTRQWNVSDNKRYRQKPLAITKQKPDKERKLRDRNAERARQKGIEYVKREMNL